MAAAAEYPPALVAAILRAFRRQMIKDGTCGEPLQLYVAGPVPKDPGVDELLRDLPDLESSSSDGEIPRMADVESDENEIHAGRAARVRWSPQLEVPEKEDEYIDDVKGGMFDPAAVRRARALEIEWLVKRKVIGLVDAAELTGELLDTNPEIRWGNEILALRARDQTRNARGRPP